MVTLRIFYVSSFALFFSPSCKFILQGHARGTPAERQCRRLRGPGSVQHVSFILTPKQRPADAVKT